jgi:hypothetical protein
MASDPLCDLNGAARIHVFGNARRTEAVTTNSLQDPDKRFVCWDYAHALPTAQGDVSTVLARVDSEVPATRSRRASSTSPVSV